MRFNWVSQADEAAVRRLWQQAFDDGPAYDEWYFRRVYKPERTLAAYLEDGTLIANLQFAPYMMRLHGADVPICYLVGVVTDPSYRMQGTGHKLLQEAFRRLHEIGFELILLNTHIPEYYAKIGFCYHYYQRKVNYATFSGSLIGWKKICAADCSQVLAPIYAEMCKDWDGWIIRNEQNWLQFAEDLLTDESGAIYCNGEAYIMVWQEQDHLFIKELGFSSQNALAEGLRFASALAHKLGYKYFTWDAPSFLALPGGSETNHEKHPFIMVRSIHDFAADAVAAAKKTAKLYAGSKPLWINEII